MRGEGRRVPDSGKCSAFVGFVLGFVCRECSDSCIHLLSWMSWRAMCVTVGKI